MSWPIKILSFSQLAMCLVALVVAGCGVKGDPVPPEKPVELGRGRPTYKRATEDIQIEKHGSKDINLKSPRQEDDEDDKE